MRVQRVSSVQSNHRPVVGQEGQHPPSPTTTVDLPDTFGDFFSAKIQRLRDELDATSRQPDFSVLCGPTLETFSLVTEQQVKNIILKAPKKSCMLDPVPTYLVHECLDDLIPTVTAIINESLVSGITPPPPHSTPPPPSS